MFVKFLVEKNYNNTDWEGKKECERVYLEFLLEEKFLLF
jgi:hypothetical protein